jgi:hypothetical protein
MFFGEHGAVVFVTEQVLTETWKQVDTSLLPVPRSVRLRSPYSQASNQDSPTPLLTRSKRPSEQTLAPLAIGSPIHASLYSVLLVIAASTSTVPISTGASQ